MSIAEELAEKWGFTDSEWHAQAVDAIDAALELAAQEAEKQAVSGREDNDTRKAHNRACRMIEMAIRALK